MLKTHATPSVSVRSTGAVRSIQAAVPGSQLALESDFKVLKSTEKLSARRGDALEFVCERDFVLDVMGDEDCSL